MRILFLNHVPRNPKATARARDEQVEALLQSYASPGTKIELGFPEDAPGAGVYVARGGQSVLTGLHHAMLPATLIRRIVKAEPEGYDAVIQSNTCDPAVEAARTAVRIPVIGPMRTTLHHATMLADRIALTVP